jgi:repressor LexA
MASLNRRIKELRYNAKLSQQALADKIGVSKSSINMYERGEREPSIETLEAIADFFNVDMNYLLGKSDTSQTISLFAIPIKTKKLPMLGNVACGEPIFADEQHDAYISADVDLDADFCLTAKGDSMINARIFDGDILFVRSQDTVDDGEIAVILIEDEATVKRVYYDKENNILTLVPENPMYKPMRYSGAELDRIRVLGKVVSGQYSV